MTDADTTELDDATRIVEKIQKLLSKAASTNFSAERDTALKLADQLMVAHAIQQFQVDMHKPKDQRRNKPELRVFNVALENRAEGVDLQKWSALNDTMWDLFQYAVLFTRCRMVVYSYRAKVVGYHDDLQYLQELFLSLQMQMLSALSPRVDTTQDLITNLVSLKEAGLKWEEIFDRLKAGGFYSQDQQWERRIGVKYTGDYKKFCDATGRDRKNTGNPKLYFRSFIAGYKDGVWRKMEVIRRERNVGDSNALVLMKDEIAEFIYDLYPERRPHEPDCKCEACHTCQDPKCKRANCVARRKPVRYSAYKEDRIDPNAMRNGRAVGSNVDLGGSRLGDQNRGAIGS